MINVSEHQPESTWTIEWNSLNSENQIEVPETIAKEILRLQNLDDKPNF